MKKRGKRYNEALSKIDKTKLYSKEEAVSLVKETSNSKFDSTIEVAMYLNLDTKKADQQLRGAVVLPNGTGKTKKVLVIARGDAAKAAKEAGAKVIAFAGRVADDADTLYDGGIDSIFSILNEVTSLDDALKNGEHNLEKTVENVVRLLVLK